MISNLILVIVWGFALGIATAMQSIGLTSVQPISAFTSQNSMIATAHQIMPYTTISVLSTLSVFLTFGFLYATYTVIRWGYSKIPGIN